MGELYAGQCPFHRIEHPEGQVACDFGISRELVDDPASYGPYGAEEIADFMRRWIWTPGSRPRPPRRPRLRAR